MLPKNKLRNVRLERLKIFEEGPKGIAMTNVMRRYDQIAIAPKKGDTTSVNAEEGMENVIRATKAMRMEDTPPLGSLGGQQPMALHVPKVKAPKVKRRKPAPDEMKIFDEQGRQWGRRKWKEVPSSSDTTTNKTVNVE